MADEENPSLVRVDRFLRMDGKALTMRPPPAPAAQRLKVWSTEEIWSAARGTKRPREPIRAVDPSLWQRAAQHALSHVANQPDCDGSEDLVLSKEAQDLLGEWMEDLLQQTLSKAARLTRHRSERQPGDDDDVPVPPRITEITAEDVAASLELQGFPAIGC